MKTAVVRSEKSWPYHGGMMSSATESYLRKKFGTELAGFDIEPGDYITIHPLDSGAPITFRVSAPIPQEPSVTTDAPKKGGFFDLPDGDLKEIDLKDTWQKKYVVAREKLLRQAAGKERIYPEEERNMLSNKCTQQEFVTKVVARHGLNEEQAELMLGLLNRPEWVERFCFELLAANMTAGEDAGLEMSPEVLGYVKE